MQIDAIAALRGTRACTSDFRRKAEPVETRRDGNIEADECKTAVFQRNQLVFFIAGLVVGMGYATCYIHLSRMWADQLRFTSCELSTTGSLRAF